ncbi:hypothetical protein H4R24_003137 [Coemansia sp. RSA 988]|nr:hypothetical protein H4R24_003137 [Coemansia sp. RSA 988]
MVEIKAQGILFDMDGTLVDTTVCVEKAWRTLGAKYGVDINQLLKNVHGRPSLDTIKEFFPETCHTVEFAKEFELSVVNITEGVHAVPGVYEAVAAVDRSKWAVVTAASKIWAKTRLGQVGLPLPNILISAEDVTNGKPNPEGYLHGTSVLGQEPKNIVIFEDAVNGVKAGVTSGATVIAVLTSTSRRDLLAAGAHHIVDDFTKVKIVDHGDHISLTI